MMGIPSDYLEYFLQAWKEPFHGVELTWLQIEICRIAMEPKSINEIFEIMSNKYTMAAGISQSNFYRIVNDNLLKNGYLEEKNIEGRSKIIQTTPKGAKQIGRLTRYLMEIQVDRVKHELWTDLLYQITPTTGCILTQNTILIGPEYNASVKFANECINCPPQQKNRTLDETGNYLDRIIFLDIGASLEGKTKESTINKAEYDNFPFKSEFADIVIEMTAIASFPENDILAEIERVLKPGGWVVLFEITKMTSKIVLQFLKEIAYTENIANPNSVWKIDSNPPELEDVLDKIREKENLEIKEIYGDIVTSIILVQKIDNN